MASKYLSPIKWVGGAAVIVFVIGLLWIPFKEAALSEETQSKVLVSAIPFVAIFIAILLTFILVIVLLATRFNGKLPRRLYRPIEFTIISGIGVSIVLLFQPWQLPNQQLGFVPAEVMWMIASAFILTMIRSIGRLPRNISRLLDAATIAIIGVLFIVIVESLNKGIGFDFIPQYVLGGLVALLVLAALYFGEHLPVLDDYERNEHAIMAAIVVGLVVFFAVVVRELDWVPADIGPIKSVQDEVVHWMDRWQLIGYEFGFILLMFSTLSYILWSHIVPGSRAVDAGLPPLASRHHMIGLVLGLIVLVVIAGGLATLNQPKEPYGMRQRQFDTLSEEQQAVMVDEANDDFTFIEVPFLIFVALFPASIIYYVTREAALAMEDDKDSRPMAQALPGSGSVTT